MSENGKVAPKFKTQFLSGDLPTDANIAGLRKWCKALITANLMPMYDGGAFGNLSFRIKEGEDTFIVTASGMKAADILSSFVLVDRIDLEQNIVYARGERAPSSESFLHYLIYRQRKDINAVFHGHCDKLLNCYTELGIPCTVKEEPYGTLAMAQAVLEISDKSDFIIIKNHGFLSLGKTMDAAGERALAFATRRDGLGTT